MIGFAALFSSASIAQTVNNGGFEFKNGKEIFEAACINCHGPEGQGMPKTTVGFEAPSTFPDFTDCKGTSPEDNATWRTIITNGGPGRGFSPIMPSFSEALTPQQINMVIEYLRSFCKEPVWPRGELNLPRALVTEKAFPENEVILTTAVNAKGAPGISNEFSYERRIGARNQIEVSVPFSFERLSPGSWFGGIGDTGLGLKRVLFSSLNSGSIFSVQGEAILPTGNRLKGAGSGVTTFETFGAFGQLFPRYTFLQLQGGADLPVDTSVAPRSLFLNAAVGKSFTGKGSLGRWWTPMFEVVGDRDLVNGAVTNWDVIPEMQVTLSKRQHIRADLGVRVPVNNTRDRPVQIMFYVLWDWFDGSLKEGWK